MVLMKPAGANMKFLLASVLILSPSSPPRSTSTANRSTLAAAAAAATDISHSEDPPLSVCTVGLDGERVCDNIAGDAEGEGGTSEAGLGAEKSLASSETESWCIDRHENCPTWVGEGLKYRSSCREGDMSTYLRYNCARSCGTCEEEGDVAAFLEFCGSRENLGEPILSRFCLDTHNQCSEWAQMGECDNNPKFMKVQCRWSCMMCYEGTDQFGVTQRIPEDEPDAVIDATRSRIETSVTYMKNVWMDNIHERVRYKCRNQHKDCTLWAASGQCESNEGYMSTNCAPACGACDSLDVRHRCPILPGNECIWQSGDLNALFENIVDDADGSGAYQRYNPRALSRPKFRRDGTTAPGYDGKDGPWVISLENFVTDEEAGRLIELGKNNGYSRSSDVGKENPDGTHVPKVSDSRTSYNTWCNDVRCIRDPLVVSVTDRIANVTGTAIHNSEYLQLLQYEPGQYYRQHHDYISHHKEMPCGVRILTMFLYLNDVEEGGGTKFPLLNITVQPKKGNAVLWPSVLDEAPEDKDGRTDHEALSVEKGIKYGANAWIHSRNFKEAYSKKCH